MNESLTFSVPGEPTPKGRPRTRVVTTKTGKSFARIYTPQETQTYEHKVRLFCQIAVNRARWTWTKKDRFEVTITVYRTHEGRGGDVDNYGKVMDALNAIAFGDDRYVRRFAVELSQDAQNPRVEIVVTKLKEVAA